MFNLIPKNNKAVRLLMNVWPPFLFSGISIVELSTDFKYCLVKLKNWSGTRNVNGAQYGGSLFAMTDPIYSIMLISILGKKYYVWDSMADIEFVKPGIGEIYFKCEISEELLTTIYEQTKQGNKYFPTIKNKLYDSKGNTVAIVERTLYIRLKPEYRNIKS